MPRESNVRRGRPGDRQVTRERVLAAAERLFLARGYLAVTIEDIAQRAGYTRGAVYSNFANKEELMFAVHERRSQRQREASSTAVLRASSDVRTLEALGSVFAREVHRLREWTRAELEFLAVAAERPDLVDRIVREQRHGRALYAEFLVDVAERLGVVLPADPDDFATAVIALQRGLLIEWLVDPAVDIGRIFADTFARLLRAGDEAQFTVPTTTGDST